MWTQIASQPISTLRRLLSLSTRYPIPPVRPASMHVCTACVSLGPFMPPPHAQGNVEMAALLIDRESKACMNGGGLRCVALSVGLLLRFLYMPLLTFKFSNDFVP